MYRRRYCLRWRFKFDFKFAERLYLSNVSRYGIVSLSTVYSGYNLKASVETLFEMCDQLLHKVEVGVINRSRRPMLITLLSTLIILDITNTECNNYFIIHWRKKTKRANLTWITLRNPAPQSYMTWLPLTSSVLGLVHRCSISYWSKIRMYSMLTEKYNKVNKVRSRNSKDTHFLGNDNFIYLLTF